MLLVINTIKSNLKGCVRSYIIKKATNVTTTTNSCFVMCYKEIKDQTINISNLLDRITTCSICKFISNIWHMLKKFIISWKD